MKRLEIALSDLRPHQDDDPHMPCPTFSTRRTGCGMQVETWPTRRATWPRQHLATKFGQGFLQGTSHQ
jgi:hypothetical protein